MTVQIVTGFHDGTGNVIDLADTDSANIKTDAIVVSSTSTAVYGTGSAQIVNLAGSLVAAFTGVSLGDDGSLDSGDKVVVGQTGSIHAVSYGITIAGHDSTIINKGLVESNYVTINTSGNASSGVSTFTNSGEIYSFGGFGISRTGSQEFHFTNTGLVDAATAYSSGDTDARQVIDNKGTIIGNITLGAGSDAYHGAQGILREGTLYASMGQDEIVGGASREKFDGGAGKDDLTGGGADTFIFAAASDTKAAFSKCDIIEDFSHKQHDKIDLGQIDAKPKTGSVDPFTFIDTQDFHGKAGELHYVFKGANTFLSGDIDGDKVADFTIGFHGHVALSGDDFLPVL